MGHILGIKFADHGQPYYFDAGPFVVEQGRFVLVKTDQGLGMGEVVDVRDTIPPQVHPDEVKPIYRLANDEDLEQRRENLELGRQARDYSRACIRERELDMKLVDVEVFFDRSKMVFYFTAPGRIDFRDLVKDLVRQYRTRIELRQIGVRHETQMIGALGNCGQTCCCRRFLRKFHPVTIKMAKEQNLFLNPTKISGICGRLLCCLSFEQHNYEEFHARCPRIGKKFTTTLGRAKVIRLNFFRQTVQFILEDGGEKEVSLSEWEDITGRQAEAGLAGSAGSAGAGEEAEGFAPESEEAPQARVFLSAPHASPSPPSLSSAPEAPAGAARRSDGRRDRPRRDRRPGPAPRPEGQSQRSEGQSHRPEGQAQGGQAASGRRPEAPRRPENTDQGGAEGSAPRSGERPAEQAADRAGRPASATRRPRRKRHRRPGPEQGS